ncbi:MAG TPA: DUF1206 domain-containing protein [Pyrinomonadaceae bacterium]|nr:DUF1206 domain-containing protein [Pyrinomonadaceae bacterium]
MSDETQPEIATVVRAAARTDWARYLARLGFYTKGVLFFVIGSLALSLIFGIDGGRLADARGALAAIELESYGRILLVIFVIGAFAHGAWNIFRGAADADGCGKKWWGITVRSVAVLVGLFYIGLAISAVEIIWSSRAVADSSEAEETLITLLRAVPGGSLFVVLIGIGIVIAGIHECYSGLAGKFRDNYRNWQIKGINRPIVAILGIVSFSARALLLSIIGYFFIRAPFVDGRTHIGLDAALLTLLGTPYGRAIVLFTASGLVAHGILAFYEAKYRRIS